MFIAPQTTASAAQAYAAPTPGAMGTNIRAIAKMGNAADLVLSLKSSDDATGTNAADYPVNVPIYVDGVKQADAKAVTIDDATGNFIVDVCIDPLTIPAGKFVGLAYANSNAGNLVTTMIVEDVTDKPTAS